MSSNDPWPMSAEGPKNMKTYQRDGVDLTQSVHQGQKVTDLRQLADISAAEFARQIGISTQELLAIEAGLLLLRPALAKKMADALQLNYASLWAGGSYEDQDTFR